jgi:hypothetical protein
MDRNGLYSFVGELCNFAHRARAHSMGRIVEAIVAVGVARTWSLAGFVAERWGMRFKSGLQAVSRALGNDGLDWWKLGARLLENVTGGAQRVPFAIDWTEWHDELRVLVGAAVIGKRAVPIAAQAFHRAQMPRSQNARENAFLRMVRLVASEANRALVILTDRGFRRVSWIALLLNLKLEFAVRLMDDVFCQIPGSPVRAPLSQVSLRPGQKVDLGLVELRQDGAVQVRVIGVWARGQKEPWWIATNLPLAAEEVASFYDRRMAVEEQLRDAKGCRYGVEIFWTKFVQPERIGRLFILVGIAIAIWTAAGAEISNRDPTARFAHRTKGPRRSFVTIGRQATRGLGRALGVSQHWLNRHLPGLQLRDFAPGLAGIPPGFEAAPPAGAET